MDIKHSDPKLSVEETWLAMAICIHIWVLAVSANIYCFLIFKLHNNLYKC